ncbi:PTS sugar transporter subunit IIB [Lacticaseibacillus pabuli]|uniref:PTS sugar transporter subunit IIB n=1 Tax=Lacticaseibacillus pabuli TaxID=3025672 RepID=A0ABY7WXU9_9LACO|nr:PTS sugar transporter subunit IIB [Lacticaseibacillus sp. KACC 23028]WDF83797.1 PTS sugar transporter subunit IIB [Lacticaseibacillus sp. KACC 23028]
MAHKVIMLACAGGMSSSLLVTKMQQAAAAAGEDVIIFATGVSAAERVVAERHPDVLMIGPQVRYHIDSLRAKLDIPVAVIDMQDYGRMNGQRVLEAALALIQDK